ncbi:uncharacterized protein LOC107045571 [Diachasma alloeum]|uniref:uncharacterized protein LOC107045571 n=1 Tax=Diachasma alloeum TaxID=454923 RepID=UPI00073816DD|nr:uncharacterized protein LOC107045571 [Diachasma alloeum]
MRYLVDIGADLCIFPKSLAPGAKKRVYYTLIAANVSMINIYSCITLSLNLSLRRDFTWRFVVANTTKQTIGAEFWAHFGILPDLKNGCLINSTTGLTTPCKVSLSSIVLGIRVTPVDSSWSNLLAAFPNLTKSEGICLPAEHTTLHHIATTPGSSLCSKARWLASNKLKIAKAEFDKMMQLGITQRSKSPWSPPLHLVPKKSGEW